MDPIVLRAMQKWPDVPRVYGWLRLDRRGYWCIKSPGGAFERIGNRAVTDFIGRNYEHDAEGRWFFQNGPQRVFVTLECTPWIYRLSDSAEGWVTHTGRAVPAIDVLHFDETGSVFAQCGAEVGLLDDRDLAAAMENLLGGNPASGDEEAIIALAEQGAVVRFFGRPVRLASIDSASVPARFGFVADPRPAPGEPEC